MKNLVLFLMVAFSICSCNDDDDNINPNVLPPATQIGANTGGCLVDGEVWVAKKNYNKVSGGAGTAIIYNTDGGGYLFKLPFEGISNSTYGDQRIKIFIKNDIELSKKDYNIFEGFFYRDNTYYIIDKGVVSFTKFDVQNKIASGEFNFTAINENDSTEMVSITQGRFDNKFINLISQPQP
ncbi:MAG: hypothetical protein ACR2MS_06700 [Weeksellaceae bacterium]